MPEWWKPQETTFTRWVNNSLRGHRTSSKNRVTDLKTDLRDGRMLAELLENLTKKSVHYMKEDRQLKFKPQLMENLGFSFKFMEKEDIKLVNIGAEDLFNGNLKLILGLIWTLITRYQIRSTGRGLSTKAAMLAWVNTQLPVTMTVQNFTTDWNSGIAICALVDRIQPGLIPHYASLNASDKLKNCSLAMGLAEDKLKIHKIMEPSDLSHPDVDELSVMTYISYFCEPVNAHLLKWVQSAIPECNVKNFTTDWNDGIKLAHLLEALNPGGFPDCKKLSPDRAKENLGLAMKRAEEQLGIKPILTPEQMADPIVDELNIVTYLSRFQNAKPLPQPQAVSCDGEGLRKAIVGRTASFEVDTTRGGSGDLAVVISCDGKPLEAKMAPNFGKKALYGISYTPEVAGRLSIGIRWGGTEIPTSPYHVDVVDPKAVSLTGPQISEGKSARVGQLVKMEAKGVTDLVDLEVTVQSPKGHAEEAKCVSKGRGLAECSYTPRVVGVDKVTAKVAGVAIPGSPFSVKVIDPKLLSVTLRDPKQGQPLLLGSKATFAVTSSEGEVMGVAANLVIGSGGGGGKGSTEIPLKVEKPGSSVGVATPTSVGKQEIRVTCEGDDIKGSPIAFQVIDPAKCTLNSDLPKVMHVGKPLSVRLSTRAAAGDAGPALSPPQAKSSDSGTLSVECREDPREKGVFDVKLTPLSVGVCSVSVDWNGHVVAGTPCDVAVCDATKCKAYGEALLEGKGRVKEVFEFTMETKGAGKAAASKLKVVVKGPKSSPTPSVVRATDEKHTVSFTTFETGDHSIQMEWCGVAIPGSPYTVDFYKPAAAGSFTATGEGLKRVIARQPASFMIMGPESGLLQSKILKIVVGKEGSGGGSKSTMVKKASELTTGRGRILVMAEDRGNGAYAAQYVVPTAGKHTLSVSSDGEEIPGSPFAVNVLPAPDASKCVAFGAAMDNPTTVTVQQPLEFKVDSTEAGTGELSVTCKDPRGADVPVFLTNGKPSAAGKMIHAVKIDPSMQGKHVVSVQWSGKDIPKSPFTFDVNDPKAVVVIDLADSADYVGRKGEAVAFSADTRKAGPGELKAAAKYDDGKLEAFAQKKNKDGTIKLSHTPTREGRLELLLTFCGVNILPAPWVVEISDPSVFKVVPPKDPTKKNEYVRFVITGLKKKQSKAVTITAKNKAHDATVKLEFSDQGPSMARFTAKEIGEYSVQVKVAKKDIPGSPFTCLVVDPEKCTVGRSIATVIPTGVEKQFTVDTEGAGPGELVAQCLGPDGNPSSCLFVVVSSGTKKTVKMTGKNCGRVSLTLKYAGYDIPTMPIAMTVTDPARCTFSCKGIDDGESSCKTDDKVTIEVNTTAGGNCLPEVAVSGPKSSYDVALKKTSVAADGRYTATFTPWQEGENRVQVTVGGVNISGSPRTFVAHRPLDLSKVTVSGPGLKGAVANRRAEVTVYARESKLYEKGVLDIAFEDELVRDFEVYDQMNGTYSVSFTPKDTGNVRLRVGGGGNNVTGSPFNINVEPEPDPSKCRVQNRSGEEVFSSSSPSSLHHLAKTAFELGVVTTSAGKGKLVASGKDPKGTDIRIFTNNERTKDRGTVTYIKFDPSSIGVYTLSLTWDNQPLKGSPYSIKVVDPSKCRPDGTFPSCLRCGDEVSYRLETSQAGEGEVEVSIKEATAEGEVREEAGGVRLVVVKGVALGNATVDVRFAGYSLSGSPFALSICDPARVSVDFGETARNKIHNVNAPLKFPVLAQSNAGRAKLQVLSSKRVTSSVVQQQLKGEESRWEVTLVPKEIGTHSVRVLWGEWDVVGSPFDIVVCDPNSVRIEGLPNPDEDFILVGQPVTFTADTSAAGSGSLICRTIANGNVEEEVSMEEVDSGVGITSMQFAPSAPGKVQLVLEFNGMSVLPKPHVYDVPDPSQFKVTPPKGYGHVKEYTKFSITGVKEDTELDITASHPDHEATVKTERGPDSTTIVARITPKVTGEYQVSVKHAGQHVDGSPFVARICDPDACQFIGEIPTVVHVGVEPKISVDTSQAGPGELRFATEVVEGMSDMTTTSAAAKGEGEGEEEGGMKWVLAMKDGVGKLRVTTLWGGYNIPNSPFVLSIVDSQRVTWSCQLLDERDALEQGETMRILVDGSQAGDVVPEVLARGPEGDYPIKIAAASEEEGGEEGAYSVTLSAWQVGRNEVSILWGGQVIPDMPISFKVTKSVEARAIAVSGEGLTEAIALREAVVAVNALEPGLLKQGSLKVKFGGSEEEEEGEGVLPEFAVTDEGEGHYKIVFVAPTSGRYFLRVLYKEKDVPNSPFEILVGAPPNAALCRAFGEALERQQKQQQGKKALFVSDDPIKFSVDTSKAGCGTLSTAGTRPDDEPIYVYALAEGDLHHLKFDPVLIGRHVVEVKWSGENVPGSPFGFDVVDPTQCVLVGVPSEGAHMQVDEPIGFKALMEGVGECVCTPEVTVATRGGATFDLKAAAEGKGDEGEEEEEEGTFCYRYTPKTSGKTTISVKIAGEDVPKSPFSFTVVDSSRISIAGLNLQGDYAIACEPVTLEIAGLVSEDEELLVTAHGPSADLSVETVEKEASFHTATFVPIEPGSYEVFVEYAGTHVKGSPLSVKVADPSKCQVLGGVLSSLQVGRLDEMTIKTRGCGEGKLKALVKFVDESRPTLECEVKDIGLDTYTVFMTGKEIGRATIDLQWAGFSIPNSPFLVNVCDASLCRAQGDILTSKRGKAGTPVVFTVETADAGDASLDVTAKGPSAQYTVTISELKTSTFEVSFTPWEIGGHKIEVLWGSGSIPGSPFLVNVGSPLDEVCNATGDGLKHGIAGRKTSFTIICSETGLLDKDGGAALRVSVSGVTAHAEVTLTDNNNGCYLAEYVPPSPGAYVASVLFHDRHIPGSPFKVTVDSGPDASKCKAYGPALHPNALAIAGSPLEFFVETASAGYGKLKVYIQGPNDYRPKVFMANDEKGTYSVKFDAMKSGRYFVLVVWSDQHIPNSPFKLRVHPAANASKVKAFGPGLLDGFIGTPGQFTIETRNAGIGTLLIRIHGLKNSFKIEAHPLSDADPRTLIVTYSPKLVGEYTIFVRWSGVHIPGSPYTIHIKQIPGEHNFAVEPARPMKKVQKKAAKTKATPERKSRPISTSSTEPLSPQRKISAGAPPTRQISGGERQRKISGAPDPTMKKSPSGGAIGMSLIGPGMRLKDNPALAKSLAQSLPPGYSQGGYVAQEEMPQQQVKVVQKKKVVKKRVVRKRHRSSSGARTASIEARSGAPVRATSPRRDDSSAVPGPSRRSRAMSPAKRRASAEMKLRKSVSPPRRNNEATSPARKLSPVPPPSAGSPVRKISASSPVRKISASSHERRISGSSRERKISASSPERKVSASSRERKISASSPERRISASSRERKISASSPVRKISATSPVRTQAYSQPPPASSAMAAGARDSAMSPTRKVKKVKKKKVVKKATRAKSPPPQKQPPPARKH